MNHYTLNIEARGTTSSLIAELKQIIEEIKKDKPSWRKVNYQPGYCHYELAEHPKQ